MAPVTVAFATLGCKLNQLETEAVADAFRRAGASVVPLGEAAELYIVNTCTVTGKAEQKARRIIRAAEATGSGGARDPVALVTGCYAEMEGERLESIGGRVMVVPGAEKAALLDLAGWLADRWDGSGDLLDALREWRRSCRSRGLATAGPPGEVDGDGRPGDGESGVNGSAFAFNPSDYAFRSRPALKIQDGCDNRCAYCRVRLARGPSRSLGIEEAVARARALEAAGRAEIVLTGVNISQYGSGGQGFPGLLAALLDGTSSVAFRVSSYEPDRVDAGFLEVFAHPRVRPHAHLPVQSGSDAVLGRMGRAYRKDRVLRAAEGLRKAKGDLFLASDFICGFPGETEADFAESLEVARDCGFAWIHAFPFSPRPGTAAADMRPRIPERVAGERVAALGAAARSGRAAYIGRWVGSRVEAVLEAPSGTSRPGTSSNYLKLRIESVPPELGAGAAILCEVGSPLRGPAQGAGEGEPDASARYLSLVGRGTARRPVP